MLDLLANDYFNILELGGQTTATASISNIVTGGVDGDTVTNAQAQPRSIILNLRIKDTANVETAKREILKVVKLKQKGSIIWEQNKREVTISGLVESVEMPRWNNTVTMQITLHCEQPFWEDIEDVIQEINSFIDLHYFTDFGSDMLYFPVDGIPFGLYDIYRTKTFNNAGDVSIGMQIEIIAFGTVTNPIIYDTDGNFFGIGYGTGDKQVVMQNGDIITITTHKGNKTVKLNGVSLYDKIKPKSTWLQMQTGDNLYRVDSDDESIENMSFNLIYKQRYI